ncbi:hypothetical protein ACIA8E_23205 [Streptomyces sp. NPDC051664]|uniref:hypothetical protein n=1 Tax=Streptomyces sp. NPDC051664 TaxID=3365668 RepID=UPI00379B090F
MARHGITLRGIADVQLSDAEYVQCRLPVAAGHRGGMGDCRVRQLHEEGAHAAGGVEISH